MAQRDVWRRYLDAGVAFTEMTRARAEAIVKDLVKAGEVPRQRAQESIDELIERSRKNTEALVALVQAQVQEQLHAVGIATKDDIARLEAKLDKVAKGTSAGAKKAPAKKAAAKKSGVGPEGLGRRAGRGRLRRRLDAELVRRGLAHSREQAQAAIASGRVVVGGAPAPKSSRLVSPSEPIHLEGPGPRFVSRGGEKLDAAIDRFAIDVSGRRALDAGASTGGFCDCLLQRGAAEVIAVDVGHGQLDARLRGDVRVCVLERTNVRDLTRDDIGGQPVDLVSADLSFISLRTVAPTLVGLAGPGADLVLLVKPQFEAGRVEADRGGGVIRDPVVWRRVLGEVLAAFAGRDAAMMGLMVSPLTGPRGNVEFLAHLAGPGGAGGARAVDIDAVVAEAAAREGL